MCLPTRQQFCGQFGELYLWRGGPQEGIFLLSLLGISVCPGRKVWALHYLGGGDFDGDKLWVCFDTDFVRSVHIRRLLKFVEITEEPVQNTGVPLRDAPLHDVPDAAEPTPLEEPLASNFINYAHTSASTVAVRGLAYGMAERVQYDALTSATSAIED
eukprot:5478692-Amphidinium_carterae.1